LQQRHDVHTARTFVADRAFVYDNAHPRRPWHRRVVFVSGAQRRACRNASDAS
jgi:hypothetical protein